MLFLQAPPKGFSSPYDPHNFDEYYAQEYGGFTAMDSSRRGGRDGGGRGGGGRGGGRGMRGGRYVYTTHSTFMLHLFCTFTSVLQNSY